MVRKSRQIRLFISQGPLQKGERMMLDANAAHYLKSVMRVMPGEEIKIFNAQAGEWRVCVISVAKNTVEIELLTQERRPQVLPEIHLCFCPLKPTPIHFLIEKATELGVTHLHPLLSERTVVRCFKEDKNQRVAIEAAEQCERLTIPEFSTLMPLESFLKMLDPDKDQVLYCDERRTGSFLTHALHPLLTPYIFIGPEGGFTQQEIHLLSHFKNSTAIKLSGHILRAETAALTALAQWSLAKEALTQEQ